jgi:hypothetical protein
MTVALIHVASREVRAGRIPDEKAQAAVVATVLGATTVRDAVAAKPA